jgi:hypothetical protein
VQRVVGVLTIGEIKRRPFGHALILSLRKAAVENRE